MEYEYEIHTAKVGERGQVTIPKALRTRYGVRPGEVVAFEETADGLLVKKITADDTLEALRGSIREKIDVDRYLDETRGPRWSKQRDG